MKTLSHSTKKTLSAHGQMALVFVALTVLVAISVSSFLRIYSSYNSGILYAERLKQMQEVTEQLFAGLEDVVKVQWQNAKYECNYLKKSTPETTDELISMMQEQAELDASSDRSSTLIAVDSWGRYYTQAGKQGLMADMTYLAGRPERISYVTSSITSAKTQMVFLYHLDEPIVLQDNVQIIYYGLAQNMDELNPYFDCKAYDGNNSIYVVDGHGLKLFSGGSGRKDLLGGFNIFSVLRNMRYLHDTSFDETLQNLQEDGLAYSNAILDNQEYYYALYQMESSAWILIFLVPSSYVATNTVQLVNTTTKMLMLFAVLMAAVCVTLIYCVLRIQQSRALRIVEANNAVLEASNRQLERAQAATAEALQAAETASKAKTDFLSNMSHDIRTPMNAIIGLTTLMKNEPGLSDRMQEYLDKLESSGHHLLELINNVLDMSRIESGHATLHITRTDLAEQITQVDNVIRPQANARNQTLRFVTTNLKHKHVLTDSTRLQQVLINLLSNAVKYTPNGGHILFELEELPRNKHYAKYRIVVQDDGIGMSKEFLQHLFDPFSRAENSVTNKVQGTGLGMAITKSIVDLMGGVIHVESTPGSGSRFEITVEMPIDASSDKPESHTKAAPTDDVSPLNGIKFLCAEDNEINAEILQVLLESKGASCKIYPNGKELVDAFASVRPGDYDMILIDIQMPVMDGLEATRRIRSGANPLGKTIPIFAMTANAFLEDIQKSKEAGMDEHLSKPVDIKVLEQTVQRFRSSPPREDQ